MNWGWIIAAYLLGIVTMLAAGGIMGYRSRKRQQEVLRKIEEQTNVAMENLKKAMNQLQFGDDSTKWPS